VNTLYNLLFTKGWGIEEIRNVYTHLIRNLKRIYHFGHSDVTGKIVLICILETEMGCNNMDWIRQFRRWISDEFR
jgi:hypothetical protein